MYSESAEEPNPEKPCPFLFSVSRRAVHYSYAEAKVFERFCALLDEEAPEVKLEEAIDEREYRLEMSNV